MRIVSWNINGIRAFCRKNGDAFLRMLQPDIICLQEIKCSGPELSLSRYEGYWNCGEKKGYAGTAILTKMKPVKCTYTLPKSNLKEGRIITAEYKSFILITTYFPNSGNKLQNLKKRLAWDTAFCSHIKLLKKLNKPMIICGDFNISQTVKDIKQPKRHYNKHPGYTQKEIDSFKKIVDCNLTDVYRTLYKDGTSFSFFSYLANNYDKNVGYRCDLFLVSKEIFSKVIDTKIYNVTRGMKLSDHCLISLELVSSELKQ